jgi:putative ABC transport system substrate-binding protein
MAINIARRKLIAALGGTALLSPLAARAQQAGPVRRIGVLIGFAESDPDVQSWFAAFRGALAKLGWAEGRNIRRPDLLWA